MDLMLLMKAVVMGLVEGLTEFLPISSTGHLILAGHLLGFDSPKAHVFDIAIQTGAILAVIMHYWQRLRETAIGCVQQQPASLQFVLRVLVAFLPAVVLGLLFGKAIKAHLFTPLVVATTFILGGLVILWAEKRQLQWGEQNAVAHVDEMTLFDALKVGLVQCLALVPGTSRSGATIIGGMLMGLSRQTATHFSFYLSIPTLIGAGVYSLYKDRAMLAWADLPMFGVGFVFALISAWLCIRWLLRYVATHSFVGFAWYRIAFGLMILVTSHMGWIHWAE
jgi:undecaprenyl-diphosphatase